jgi:hypothetical protein
VVCDWFFWGDAELMAQIQTNPWSFVAADQATSVAITSITPNGITSATVVTGSAHGLSLYENISIQGTTIVGWRNGYEVLAIPSTTSFIIAMEGWQANLAANGANGNVLSVAYPMKIRIEQALWNNPTAAGALLITDVNGNLVWNPTAGAAGTTGPYTYGKLYWIDGLVINALPSGTLQLTIN